MVSLPLSPFQWCPQQSGIILDRYLYTVRFDVLAERLQLILSHQGEQFGCRMDLDLLSPALKMFVSHCCNSPVAMDG
jgi:hypothetical protein